jgi:hypothetical protein
MKRKKALDQKNMNKLMECEQDYQEAQEKRKLTQDERRKKLQKHIAKVEERCREQAQLRASSTEKAKNDLEKKLEQAAINKEGTLTEVKNKAHFLGEKRKTSSTAVGGPSYDDIPVPTHQPKPVAMIVTTNLLEMEMPPNYPTTTNNKKK